MINKQKTSANLGLIIGSLGLLAGILLMIEAQWFIGIFGSIASGGIAYKGYQDSKAAKDAQ